MFVSGISTLHGVVMAAAPWVYRRWESQVDRGTYFFYEDDQGNEIYYIKGPCFHFISYDIDVLDSLDGGCFFGSDRYSSMTRSQHVGLV